MFRSAAAALMMVLGFAVLPAAAAEPSAAPLTNAAATATADSFATDTDWSLPTVHVGRGTEGRGALLPSLYVSLAALNAFDAVSTRNGLSHGAVEGNALMQGVAGHTSSMLAVKSAATVSTILVAEHLWKNHHKGQAIAAMIISNSLMSVVAMHNNSVMSSVR